MSFNRDTLSAIRAFPLVQSLPENLESVGRSSTSLNMAKRHLILTTFNVMAAVIVISVDSSHGKMYSNSHKVTILNCPPPMIKVLTGNTIDLLWRYRVEPNKKLKVTSWYSVYVVENRQTHTNIIRKKHNNGGVPEKNPSLDDDKRSRTSCKFSSEKQVWSMHCRITEANVEDSAVYGIQLDLEGIEDVVSNTSDVKVIDIKLNKKESDSIVQSWVSRTTVLTCAIHRKVYMDTAYEWYFVTEDKDITRGITWESNKTSYSFIPLSKRDFGKYRCTISTTSSIVEHTIDLQQIDYSGAPEDLQVPEYPGDVRLYWKRPSSDGGTTNIDYVVETRATKDRHWRNAGKTTRLSVALKNFENLDRVQVRVCSRNKIGIGPRSCTDAREVHVGQTQRPKSGCTSIVPLKYQWMFLHCYWLSWIIGNIE